MKLGGIIGSLETAAEAKNVREAYKKGDEKSSPLAMLFGAWFLNRWLNKKIEEKVSRRESPDGIKDASLKAEVAKVKASNLEVIVDGKDFLPEIRSILEHTYESVSDNSESKQIIKESLEKLSNIEKLSALQTRQFDRFDKKITESNKERQRREENTKIRTTLERRSSDKGSLMSTVMAAVFGKGIIKGAAKLLFSPLMAVAIPLVKSIVKPIVSMVSRAISPLAGMVGRTAIGRGVGKLTGSVGAAGKSLLSKTGKLGGIVGGITNLARGVGSKAVGALKFAGKYVKHPAVMIPAAILTGASVLMPNKDDKNNAAKRLSQTFFGDEEGGFGSAWNNALKWGLTTGSLGAFAGPLGAIASGIGGAAIGGVTGLVGAKRMRSAVQWVQGLFGFGPDKPKPDSSVKLVNKSVVNSDKAIKTAALESMKLKMSSMKKAVEEQKATMKQIIAPAIADNKQISVNNSTTAVGIRTRPDFADMSFMTMSNILRGQR